LDFKATDGISLVKDIKPSLQDTKVKNILVFEDRTLLDFVLDL
jgi:hypothetical protein